MRRGEPYRVASPSSKDSRRSRVFVIVSRQVLIESRFSTVTCAPVYPTCDGLSTQVPIGIEKGLKHDSCIHCDKLVSLPKSRLNNYVGILPPGRMERLSKALHIALDLTELVLPGQ